MNTEKRKSTSRHKGAALQNPSEAAKHLQETSNDLTRPESMA